jgi:protein required for attachment to host cells
MDKITIQSGEWVVVCDGRKAILFVNRGNAIVPDLRAKEVYEHEVPPTHAIGTDTPGRVQPSVGTARSAVEQTDWHDEEERSFLARLVEWLETAIAVGEVKRLVMIAPPRALGVLRKGYSPALRKAVRVEVGKDYVRLPAHEIETQLTG